MDKDKEIEKGLDDNGKFAEGNQLHKLRTKVGRPRKISRFIQQFECVLEESHPVGNAIIFSDKELVFLTNDRLEPHERIEESTLAKWKKYEFKSEKDQAEAEEFRRLYEKHLLLQRQRLFEMMMAKSESRSWNRYLAVIERKFDDWNLRTKSVDETPDLKKLVFRVAPEE
jgi:CRISPR/Cas system CMR subunit Cmr4 (Cas7 group RAMP superfamily)